MRLAAAISAVGTTAATIMLAVPARADVDTDFANQLHTSGIYGQRDYNAWLAEITCQQLDDGLDSNAEKSAPTMLSAAYGMLAMLPVMFGVAGYAMESR